MNILIDTAIFSLQQQGGISKLWRSLLPALRDAMPDCTFAPQLPPDIFISTYYRPSPVGVRSLALVYDLIVDRLPYLPNRSDSADIHRAVNEASDVVSISHRTADDVKELCGRDSAVAYPGVAEDFGSVHYADVERFRQYVGKPYVLMVGKRGLYKNAQALYQAWSQWAAHINYKVLCVGGEQPLPQDIAFANRYKDSWQQVQLDDKDLALAYAGAHCLVYPSFIEGFGLPIVEAMTCGCPVVCDHTMAEIGAGAALYCDVAKPRSIVLRLDELANPALWLTHSTLGIEQAKRFTWSGMARKLADVLRSAA